jgi:hypothetical protein
MCSSRTGPHPSRGTVIQWMASRYPVPCWSSSMLTAAAQGAVACGVSFVFRLSRALARAPLRPWLASWPPA